MSPLELLPFFLTLFTRRFYATPEHRYFRQLVHESALFRSSDQHTASAHSPTPAPHLSVWTPHHQWRGRHVLLAVRAHPKFRQLSNIIHTNKQYWTWSAGNHIKRVNRWETESTSAFREPKWSSAVVKYRAIHADRQPSCLSKLIFTQLSWYGGDLEWAW